MDNVNCRNKTECMYPDCSCAALDIEEIEQLRKQLVEAKAENERLREVLQEAISSVADWGAYASDYFKQKHDLEGELKRYRQALKESE